MKKLAVRISLIGLLILLGALFGVQIMNEELGISQPVPLVVEKAENKSKDVGETTSESEKDATPEKELVDKRKKQEEVGRFNFFSDMGSHIAEGMNYVSRSLLSQVMSFVNNVLNGNGGDE